MIVHQDAAQVGFLQSAVEDDASRDVLQFHDGRAYHERNVSGTVHREDRFGVHAAGIGDGCPGRCNCDVSGGISIEKRITAEVDGKGTVRIAPEHLFKGNLVSNPRFIVSACPVGKGYGRSGYRRTDLPDDRPDENSGGKRIASL